MTPLLQIVLVIDSDCALPGRGDGTPAGAVFRGGNGSLPAPLLLRGLEHLVRADPALAVGVGHAAEAEQAAG